MSDRPTQRLTTPDDYATAVVALLQDATRTVDVFSPELNPVVFSSRNLIEAVRSFALLDRHTMLRVLVRDTTPLTRADHRLKALVERISSKIQVRALASDFHSRGDAFVLADGNSFAMRRESSTWDGLYDSSRPGIAKRLQTEFEEMWAHSLPDPGVRRLHI